jgi:VMA21-like domain
MCVDGYDFNVVFVSSSYRSTNAQQLPVLCVYVHAPGLYQWNGERMLLIALLCTFVHRRPSNRGDETIAIVGSTHAIVSHCSVCSFFFNCRLLHPQNRLVGQKLAIATFCMFTLPILFFFVARHVFRDKAEPDNWAGGAAILVTNLIVAGYCVAAFSEEDEEAQKNKNDADGPRVGVFKQRTD